MPEPTVLLLSTSDTDLITARASGAGYRWANPSRLLPDDLAALLTGVDIVVVRILGGYRAWQDGIDAVIGSGFPAVVVSGEQAPDAEPMGQSTVPAGMTRLSRNSENLATMTVTAMIEHTTMSPMNTPPEARKCHTEPSPSEKLAINGIAGEMKK